MRVFGDGHFVIQAPAPLGFTSQEVIDHPLHDLAICPRAAFDWIFKAFFPFGPAIFLTHRRGRFKNLAARGQRGGDLWPQLTGERGDGLLDIDVAVVYFFSAEEVRELLKDVTANHRARGSLSW